MYNLLVQQKPWGAGRESIPVNRLFEYTEEALAAQFKNSDSILLDKLIQLPCIFMQESIGDELAHVGTITSARRPGREILIEYSYDHNIHPIPNKVIVANKLDFGIADDWEFGRTHWAVKEIDLFRSLLRLSQPLRQSPNVQPLRQNPNVQPLRQNPKVFSIPENEEIDRRLVSVMMPFDADFADVYVTLQEAVAEVRCRCCRADEIWENPAIIQDIVTLIYKSFVVVCDCSGRNPNVFYEIGIAHTLGREVVLITQVDEDIPFDLRHIRCILYLNNGEGRQKLKLALADRLRYLKENL